MNDKLTDRAVVRLTSKQRDRLRVFAAQSHRTESGYLRHLLLEEIERRGMIEYTYSKGTQQVNYATAQTEKQYLRAKKRLEKKGFKVERL